MSNAEIVVGFLRPNATKANERAPDFRGKWALSGKEMLVSAWWKDKDGEKMLSLSLTDPAELEARKNTGNSAAPVNNSNRGYLYPNGPDAFKGRASCLGNDHRLTGLWKDQGGEPCIEVKSAGAPVAAVPRQPSSTPSPVAPPSTSAPPSTYAPPTYTPHPVMPVSSAPLPASHSPPAVTKVTEEGLDSLGLGDIFSQ